MGAIVICHSILLSCKIRGHYLQKYQKKSEVFLPLVLFYFLENNCPHLWVTYRVEMKMPVSFNGCIWLSFSCIPRIVDFASKISTKMYR